MNRSQPRLRACHTIVFAGLAIGIGITAWLVRDTGQAVARIDAPAAAQAEATQDGAFSSRPGAAAASAPREAAERRSAGVADLRARAPQPARDPGLTSPPQRARAREWREHDRLSLALRDIAPAERLRAIGAIESRADTRSAGLLAQVLGDPDARIRRVAVAALASTPALSRASVAQQALADPDALVRKLAVEALDDTDGAAGLDVLYLALHDRDAEVRAAAVDNLADSAQEPARMLLELALADPDHSVRAAAGEALVFD